MRLILLVFTVAFALAACDSKPSEGDIQLGIGANGAGVYLGNNICVNPANALPMACVEL